MPLFNGSLGQFIRKYKLVRRTVFFSGAVAGGYFIGVAAGWWPNILAEGQ